MKKENKSELKKIGAVVFECTARCLISIPMFTFSGLLFSGILTFIAVVIVGLWCSKPLFSLLKVVK